MKILVIHGSHRKGNTYQLTMEAVNRLKEKCRDEIEINEIWASKLNLPPCISCHQCFMQGEDKCPHYDLVSEVANLLVDAEGVIISAPTYAMHVPGSLKNLIDHLAYHFHRPKCTHLQGLALTTTAGAGAKDVAKYLVKTFKYFGFNSSLGYAVALRSQHFAMKDKDLRLLDRRISQFASRLNHPPKRLDYFTSMNFFMWQAMNDNKMMGLYDQNYWIDNQLFEKSMINGKKTHPIGRMVGKTVGRMISRRSNNG